MNIIKIDLNTVKKCKWYEGIFIFDCACDENLLKRKDKVRYFEYNGKYYTISTENKNEYVELPLYLSSEYPYSTGLVIDYSKPIEPTIIQKYFDFIYTDNRFYRFYHLISENIQQQIMNIEKVRTIKNQDLINSLKKKNNNWIPKCIISDGEELDSDSSYYIYRRYRCLCKKEYTWYLVPINTVENVFNNELENFYIPVVFTKDDIPLTYTSINGWEEVILPEQTEGKDLSDRLGIKYDPKLYIPISKDTADKLLEDRNNNEKLKRIVSDINYCRKYKLDFNSLQFINKLIPKLDRMIIDNEPISEILDFARIQMFLDSNGRKLVKEYLISNIGEKVKEEYNLSDEELQQFITIPYIPSYDSSHLDEIITAGEDCSVYHYDNGAGRNVTCNCPGYYNINSNYFYDWEGNHLDIPEDFKKMSHEQINKKIHNFHIVLSEVLNSVIAKANTTNKKDFEKAIILLDNYMTARNKIVLLNKNFYDMFIEFLNDHSLSFEYYFINDDFYEIEIEVRHGKITISNLDLDNINLKDLDKYYRYQEKDLSKICLKTDFYTNGIYSSTNNYMAF